MTVEADSFQESHSQELIPVIVTPTQVKVLEMEKVSGEAWDNLAVSFDGIAQEQLYSFSSSRWPNVVCEPIVVRRDGEVVGGALVMVQPLPMKLGSIAVTKWAPMLKDNNSDDAAENYARIIETLIAEYSDRRGMMLSVSPKAVPSKVNMQFDILKARGFSLGPAWGFPDRYIVNLRLSDEEIRKSFAQKWRYHLNKSLKQELSFEHADMSRLSEFDTLYRTMTDRKKFADHSAYDTISSLFETSNDALRPEIFFVRQKGEMIAGAIIFKAGDSAVYLYGATNDKALSSRAGYFMHWEIIRWLRDNTKADWYDLGGTDGFQGLHQFKKGMVGSRGFIEPTPPVMNYASHFTARAAGEFAYWAREVVSKVRLKVEKLRVDMATPDQER